MILSAQARSMMQWSCVLGDPIVLFEVDHDTMITVVQCETGEVVRVLTDLVFNHHIILINPIITKIFSNISFVIQSLPCYMISQFQS